MLLGSPTDAEVVSDAAEVQAAGPAALPPVEGRVLLLGFGCIGSALLPLLIGRFGVPADRIAILTACERGAAQAEQAGVAREILPITPQNAAAVLGPRLRPGDVLLNLAVEVSSAAVAELCLSRGAHYLDTAPEPWRGGYSDPRLPYLQRSNFGLRQAHRDVALRHGPGAPSGMIGSGANPGLVSLFLKRALLNLAAAQGVDPGCEPGAAAETQPDWADLTRRLGVKAVHITETDTQHRASPQRGGEASNTWSIASLVGEAYLPSELGFGTHEASLPPDGTFHDPSDRGSIYLARPGAANLIRSWIPGTGQYGGCIISHPEPLSIADFLTARDEAGRVLHRPTVLFAYRPCDEARLLVQDALGSDFRMHVQEQAPMVEEITGGADTLGVLLMGQPGRAYWYGSQLDAVEAQRLVPHNNATTLQVCAGVMAGLAWILENPRRGLCEAEAMDVHRGLAVARPYLGRVFGSWTRWHPAIRRYLALPSAVDRSDPWQFAGFRIT
jgi:homospermidine synthase